MLSWQFIQVALEAQSRGIKGGFLRKVTLEQSVSERRVTLGGEGELNIGGRGV